MARLRLGVALLFPAVVAAEVDGLRHALGDGALPRIPPHVTLVPPVNVRADALAGALRALRAAAAGAPARGLSLTLGPVRTFAPASPVLYLGVGGDLDALHALRDRVFREPLSRPLTFPFVPHVTLMDEASPEQLDGVPRLLDRYARTVKVDRVHLLRETPGRRWEPLADAAFGKPAVIGRGGLELELTFSGMVDPETVAALEAEAVALPTTEGPVIVVTGRRAGAVVGAAMTWAGPDGGRVEVFVVPASRGQGIGGHLLAAAEAGVRARGWGCSALVSRCGPAAFYASRSAYSKAIEL